MAVTSYGALLAHCAVLRSERIRKALRPFYRLRGVSLTELGADEAQIEEAFCRAIKTAKEQKSISWAKRAEATYAEYRRQKASATRGGGFRLPIC